MTITLAALLWLASDCHRPHAELACRPDSWELGFGIWGFAAAQDPKMPQTHEHLKPYAWLIGTWDGKGEMGGQKYTDEYVYEWTHNKNFMKSNYTMKDASGKVLWNDTGMLESLVKSRRGGRGEKSFRV